MLNSIRTTSHPNGLGGDCLSGPKRVSDRPQTGPGPDLLSQPQTQRHPTEMELHHCTESVKLILSCPLASACTRGIVRSFESRRARAGTEFGRVLRWQYGITERTSFSGHAARVCRYPPCWPLPLRPPTAHSVSCLRPIRCR